MWNFAGPRHFHVLVDVASCLLNLSISTSPLAERVELLKPLSEIENLSDDCQELNLIRRS